MNIRYRVSPRMMLIGDNGKEYSVHGVPFQVTIVDKIQRGWSALAMIDGASNGRSFATEQEAIAFADRANRKQEWSDGFDSFMRSHRGEENLYNRYCETAGQEPN